MEQTKKASRLLRLPILILTLAVATSTFAQTTQEIEAARANAPMSRAAIGFDLGGAALAYSVMGSFRPMNVSFFAINAGASYLSATATDDDGTTSSVSLVMLPVSAALLLGSSQHAFEILGGGNVVAGSASISDSDSSVTGSGSGFIPHIGAGYRYWPNGGGFFFRLTSYAHFGANGDVVPWAGMTLGYAI